MSYNGQDPENTHSYTLIVPGTKFTHYLIESRIGAGGMGEVYQARDESLDRNVALKFIPPQYAGDQNSRNRFIREARAAAALNHPNIITVYEVGEFGGRVFIAMEYVDGQTLEQLLSDGTMTIEQSVDILLQICDGLKEAHQAGIIHRDIKPSNVILDVSNRVRLLDFGLAKLLNDADLTQAGVTVGTINYMSPEQCRGDSVDQRSDIFSLGSLLYQMITGQQPFSRSTMPATLNAILNEQPDMTFACPKWCKTEITEIIRKVLQKKRESRYQNVSELEIELRKVAEAASSPSVIKEPPGQSPETPSRSRRQSLAVLYLRNLGLPEDEFLCYGITEDLIVDLSRAGEMRIASMRSILRFKDSDAKLRDISDELEVDVVLDGSINKSANSIRVSAQLVDAATEKTLWAGRWEEPHERLPQIKLALAQAVIGAMGYENDLDDQARIGVPEAKSAKAYEFYLRGKYAFVKKSDKTDVDVAMQLYEKAIAEEPSLLAAKAGIAEILIYTGAWSNAESVLIDALKQAEALGRPSDLSALLRLRARHRTAQSEWDEAEKFARQAAKTSKSMGDLAGEADALAVLIDIAGRQARFDIALTHFRRVLEISRALNDQKSVGAALKNMGTVNVRKGEYEAARALYQEAMRIARESNNTSLEADCIGNSGLTYYHSADYERAIELYQEALSIHKSLGDKSREALWTNNIAMVYESRGDYDRAMQFYETASRIHKESGDRAKYALTQSNCATMKAIVGSLEDGVTVANEALEIAEKLRFQMVVTATRDTLGTIYFCSGAIEKAAECFNDAIEIADNANLPMNLAFAHINMGELRFYLGEYTTCRQHVDRSLAIAKLIGHKEARLKASAYDAALMVRDGLVNPGIAMLRQILEESRNQGDPRFIQIAQRLLGMSLREFGRTESDREEGHEVLRQALASASKCNIALEIMWLRELLS